MYEDGVPLGQSYNNEPSYMSGGIAGPGYLATPDNDLLADREGGYFANLGAPWTEPEPEPSMLGSIVNGAKNLAAGAGFIDPPVPKIYSPPALMLPPPSLRLLSAGHPDPEADLWR